MHKKSEKSGEDSLLRILVISSKNILKFFLESSKVQGMIVENTLEQTLLWALDVF